MSIVRQNAIVALFKIQPAGGPTEGEISAYERGYNSRDEEVALLVTVLRRLYKDSMATDFNEHWDSYETATNLLHKYPQ